MGRKPFQKLPLRQFSCTSQKFKLSLIKTCGTAIAKTLARLDFLSQNAMV
jgi:hypothetical protein